MRYTRCLGSWKFSALACHIFGNVIAHDNDRNDGFGHMYKWRRLKEGFDEAKVTRKPIFLLIYKTGCPTCEKLKPKFTKSIRIQDLSQQWVIFRYILTALFQSRTCSLENARYSHRRKAARSRIWSTKIRHFTYFKVIGRNKRNMIYVAMRERPFRGWWIIFDKFNVNFFVTKMSAHRLLSL